MGHMTFCFLLPADYSALREFSRDICDYVLEVNTSPVTADSHTIIRSELILRRKLQILNFVSARPGTYEVACDRKSGGMEDQIK
jgi:hypothetical protein